MPVNKVPTKKSSPKPTYKHLLQLSHIKSALISASTRFNMFVTLNDGWLCDGRVLIRLPDSEIKRLRSILSTINTGIRAPIENALREAESTLGKKTKTPKLTIYRDPEFESSDGTKFLSNFPSEDCVRDGNKPKAILYPKNIVDYVVALWPAVAWHTSRSPSSPLIGVVDEDRIVAIVNGYP